MSKPKHRWLYRYSMGQQYSVERVTEREASKILYIWDRSTQLDWKPSTVEVQDDGTVTLFDSTGALAARLRLGS